MVIPYLFSPIYYHFQISTNFNLVADRLSEIHSSQYAQTILIKILELNFSRIIHTQMTLLKMFSLQ